MRLLVAAMILTEAAASAPAGDMFPVPQPKPETPLAIADDAPLFCFDDPDYQPFQRTNYGRLKNAFATSFAWGSAIEPLPKSDNYLLVFTKDGSEYIAYEVEKHADGVGPYVDAGRIRGQSA
jgi:hypothetical protein